LHSLIIRFFFPHPSLRVQKRDGMKLTDMNGKRWREVKKIEN
jgi:hypothetical protein